MTDKEPKPHYLAHRDRLRERFMMAGPDALADYELLEMILFAILPRRDVKPVAKDLLTNFGNLSGVMNADRVALAAIDGLGEVSATYLKTIHALLQRSLREQAKERPVLGNWRSVIDYCRSMMAHRKVEEFRLFFLDRKHGLIADELQGTGTIDHAPVYPREVARRALELGAAGIIMAHNHPSGDPTPSRADVEMTKEVAKVLSGLGIELLDHVVIGRRDHASLKSMGLF